MPGRLSIEGQLAAYLGSFEDNPAAQLARRRRVPLVVHADVVWQLHNTGQLGLLDGLAVEVENIYPGQPWQGLCETISAYDLLAARADVRPSICLDVEHLARDAQWDGRSAYMAEVWAKGLVMVGNRKVSKAHLCGLDPTTGKGHLPFVEGSLPIAEVVRSVRDHSPQVAMVVECRGREWDVVKLMKLGLGEEQAERIARESVGFIRRAWKS